MDKRYGLIEFSYAHGGGYRLRFRKIWKEENRFPLSIGYWEYGWDKVLSMSGKFCLLINLAERGRVQGEYAWTGSKDFLSERYGVSSNTIENGMRLLML